MNKNLITVDPSLNSTGVIVNGKILSYVKDATAWNAKQTKLKKWFAVCDDLVDFHYIDYQDTKGYSNTENYKLIKYQEITDKIFSDILNYIDPNKETIVCIEGYSYSSASGPLIDLVTFSTLLRKHLKGIATEFYVVSPSTLKLQSAKLTYEPINIGKKVEKLEWRNNQGVKGGAFKKHDMYRALIENKNINDDWNDMLNDHSEEILAAKSIPKPIEDINDAKLLYEITKNAILNELNLDIFK